MPVVNLADTTFGFFIPSVTLIGPGCSVTSCQVV